MKRTFFLLITLCLSLMLQAQVSKTINCTAGGLATALTASEKSTITSLTLTGTIDARDFKTMHNMPVLAELDLKNVDIFEYTGNEGTVLYNNSYYYPANVLPRFSFYHWNSSFSLNSIILPTSITSIGENAFVRCEGLKGKLTIPSSVSSIETFAFYGCKNLDTVIIPFSVSSIGMYAFCRCKCVIEIDNKNVNFKTMDNVLFDHNLTTLIWCPINKTGIYNVPPSVTTIDYGAFDSCTYLTSIVLPPLVTNIRGWAFEYCHNLTSINIPEGVKELDYNTFHDCKKINTITIPGEISRISDEVFLGCSGLISLYVNRSEPVDLSSSRDVFKNVNKTTCTLYVPFGSKHLYETADQWKDFTHIVESSTVVSTAGGLSSLIPASYRDTLTTLTIKGTIDARDFRFMRDSLPMLAVLDIENVDVVAYTGTEGTFPAYQHLTFYPANEVPLFSFCNFSPRKGKESLKSITLPSSVIKIGEEAFCECSGLSLVNFPPTLKVIGNGAFMECVSLQGELIIPSFVDTIENVAFVGCSSLTSVSIPKSVNYIGLQAFMSCSGSFSVDINNSNYSSMDGVLFNKAQTVLMQCPTSKKGNYSMPFSVLSINDNAFSDCSLLESIIFNTSLTSFGEGAFLRCAGIKAVEIPPSITTISNTAFSGCVDITSVNIPSSVTSIGIGAFFLCIQLPSIIIPSSVKSIGTSAFSNCISLSSIYANSASPIDLTLSANVFIEVDKTTCILYVPFGSKHLYETADQWKDFVHIVEMGNFVLSDFILNIPGNGGSDSTLITSNTNWTATSDQPWLTVTPTSGIGNDTLVFTAQPNQTDSIRTAQVTVSAAGVPSQVITITQNPLPVLIVSNHTLFIAKGTGSSASAEVTSNITWTAQSNQTWLRVTPSTGTGNKTIFFTANNANSTITTRTATVTLSGTDAVPQLITITQASGDTVLTVASTVVNIGYTAGSTVSVVVTSNTTWTAKSDQTWLTINPATAIGNETLIFTAEANPGDSLRTATVTVSATGFATKTIIVTQSRKPFLTVSANTVTIARGYESTASVDVVSNIAWNASSDQTWLWVSPKSGSGNKSLEFTANSANPKITTRSATVTLTGEGVPTQQIRVIQAAGDTILTVSETTLNIGYAEGSRVWTAVTSNTIWRVESDQPWLTPNPVSSEGNKNLIFTANENPNGFPRTATITVMALGSETKTITITQVAKPVLNLMTDTIYVSKEEGSQAEITINANVGWRVVPEQDWLTCSPDSGTYDDIVTVTATANPGVGKRSSVVSISGVGVGIKRVTVIQREGDPVLVVSPDSVFVEKEEGSTATVTITSNTNWDAVSDQPWLEVNPVTSTGSGELIFTAKANPTITERTAIVTVSELGVAPQQIVVTQAAGDPVVTISGEMISIAAEEGSKATMNVISNTTWTVNTDQAWLTLAPLTGNGNGIITFTAKANPSNDDRPAHVTITDGKSNTQTIVVVQLAGHVGSKTIAMKNVSLCPNPVTDGFRINGLEGRAELIVSDLKGTILLSKEIEGNEYVSTSLLAKGMYIVRITNSEGRVEKKLIKE